MNVDVSADDARQMEVLAQDFLCYEEVQAGSRRHSAQCVDLRNRGTRTCRQHRWNHVGESHESTKRPRTQNWPRPGRCKLVVMAMETGGRWSEESVEMLWELSHAAAQEAPSLMRFQVALTWERRWTRMLSVTCATAFAASLVELARHLSWCYTGGKTPLLADLFESDPM